jgi:hypothetical protein
LATDVDVEGFPLLLQYLFHKSNKCMIIEYLILTHL